MDDDTKLWSVDRSWGNHRGNSDGTLAPSDFTRMHVDRGDSTAKCSKRILLNSIDGTRPIGFGGDITADQPTGTIGDMATNPNFAAMVCRRCVPKSTDSGKGS